MKQRFSKARALAVLDHYSAEIATMEKFNRSNGTSQLAKRGVFADEEIRRAVEYGRMRAFETFAEWIEEGFRFCQPALDQPKEKQDDDQS